MSSTRRSVRTLALLLLLLLAAALLAAGCGDDDDGGSSGDSGSRASQSDEADAGNDSEEDAAADDAEGGGSEEAPSSEEVERRNDMYDEAPTERLDPKKTYVVHVKTTKGDFDIVLDQKAGPIAAANFAFLVEEGFYDGVVFHRIIKDFMVQTGDPTGSGTGGPGYSIKDDEVTGAYTRGTVAMANAGPDTGGSQFFIVHGTEVDQMLGKDYAIFGKVPAAGMRTVDKIAGVEVETSPSGEPSQPVEPVRILSMELEER